MCGICTEAVSVTRPVRRIEGGMRAARLERHRALAARADLDLDHLGGTRERGGEAAGVDPPFDQDVAGGIRMHERRARGERSVDVDHGVLGLDARPTTCSARSSASAAEAAITAAIGSPT